ncbi:hypothetical protein RN001_003579 [Aquatica leii]|uniref:Cytochrome P450 n=1 Tax=Aquatica leii TaxID=1421715 RepID=A0AAN7SRM8_9COLE|nr:hypothetical protein RN001_003579 [Aquatica leii]
MYNTYPTKRYFGIFQFHLPTLIIRDPELIKTILVKEFASFSDHSMFNRGICEPYEGLFLITAKKGWHNLRTVLSPSFTNAKLKCMFKLVDECGNSFVDYFKKLGEVPVDLKDSFSRYTNDAILTTAFGVKCESFKDKDNLILTVGKRMVDFTGIKGLKAFSYNISPFLTKLFNVQVVNEKNGKVFANIVEETLKLRKEKNIVRPDMINLMLETKAKMKTDSNEFKDQHNLELTNKDMTAAAISFYFAGFDTTSTTLTFIAYELCVNPDVQNKLRAEIDETMARCNGELTFETVMNVKYLEMVIEETLRIWSPAVFMDRLCVKTFTIQPVNPDEKPLTLHPGDNIWLPIAGLHHDSKYYDNPERFDPERFSDENKSKRHPFSYMPFGGGPRTCIVIIFLISFIYYKFLKIKDYWLKKGVPYIKPLPLVGNMLASLLKRQTITNFIINTYNAFPTKRYVGFFQFHQPTLLIRDPELVKTIMVKEFASFPDHSIFNRGICEPYEGLFFITAKRGWHDLRSILSPAFTNSKLKYMFKLVDECGNSVVDYFKKLGEIPIDLKDSFSRYTNDAILTTAVGVKCESFKDKDNLIFTVGKKMVDLSGIKGLKAFSYNISPFFTKLFNVQIVTKKAGQVFENIVEETLKMRKEKKIVRPDMINLMMETKAKVNSNDPDSVKTQHKLDFTNKDITAAAISFYFAGFDTTSTTLTFIAYSLCINPDVQNKLRKEVDEAMASCNGELTFETVMNMRYLEMVIEETLRRWSPGAFIDRLCVKSYTVEPVNPDEKPLTINPGDTVWLPISALHQDPKYFENPEKFDPERFNETNRTKRHPFSFIPFGGGPRTCIGNRYAMFVCKLLLMKIVHNFEIVPCEKTQIPLKPNGVISVLPDDGVWVTFKPISR